MSFLVNSTAAIQANSTMQTLSNKYTLAGLQVDQAGSFSVSVPANTDYFVALSGVTKVMSISIRSVTTPVQYALGDSLTSTPSYTTTGHFHMFSNETGSPATRLYIRSFSNVVVEVSYAGRAV